MYDIISQHLLGLHFWASTWSDFLSVPHIHKKNVIFLIINKGKLENVLFKPSTWSFLFLPVTEKGTLKYLTITSTGGGNGNPLQYSYLENSMDSGAWRAAVLGVAETDVTGQAFISFPIHHFLPEIASLFVFIFWSMFLGAYNVRTILLLKCLF